MDLKCRSCKKKIRFISLRSGKNCPVDLDLVDSDEMPHGTELVLNNGARFTVNKDVIQPNLRASVNHFQSCKGKKN